MHLIEQIQNQAGSNQPLINEQGFNKTRIIYTTAPKSTRIQMYDISVVPAFRSPHWKQYATLNDTIIITVYLRLRSIRKMIYSSSITFLTFVGSTASFDYSSFHKTSWLLNSDNDYIWIWQWYWVQWMWWILATRWDALFYYIFI